MQKVRSKSALEEPELRRSGYLHPAMGTDVHIQEPEVQIGYSVKHQPVTVTSCLRTENIRLTVPKGISRWGAKHQRNRWKPNKLVIRAHGLLFKDTSSALECQYPRASEVALTAEAR